jgi:hypothetical protein
MMYRKSNSHPPENALTNCQQTGARRDPGPSTLAKTLNINGMFIAKFKEKGRNGRYYK